MTVDIDSQDRTRKQRTWLGIRNLESNYMVITVHSFYIILHNVIHNVIYNFKASITIKSVHSFSSQYVHTDFINQKRTQNNVL